MVALLLSGWGSISLVDDADGAAVMDTGSLDAKYGTTPTIDGTLSAGEWTDAQSVSIVAASKTGTVRFKQDASNLFVAFEYDGTNWCEVFFDIDHDATAAPDADDLCLHASSALGERTGTGTGWSGWTWNTVTGWTATKDFGDVHEFRVSFAKLHITKDQPKTLGVAFQLFTNTETRTWPQGADDDAPATWGNLSSSDSWGSGAPNVPPVLSGGLAAPLNVTEDDPITFKVFYLDTDDQAPTVMKVVLKNATSGPVDHPLSPMAGTEPWSIGRWLGWTSNLAPGTYQFLFNASDGEDWASGDTGWNPHDVVVRPRNQPPRLASPLHEPPAGDTLTAFRFEVQYRDLDGQTPVSTELVIDGTAHTMVTEAAGPWDEWQVFFCETTLPFGDDHRYYFAFSDGIDLVRLPEPGSSPNWLRGPDVSLPNAAPDLTTPLHSPLVGTRQTFFSFSVLYIDAEGQHPSVSNIYIDGMPWAMTSSGSDYAGGVTFTYVTRLYLGPHMYHFLFNDSEAEVRHPGEGAFEGPTVVNLPPVATIDSPSDGMRFAPTDLVQFDAFGSSDPDGDTLIYSWKSDVDGHLGGWSTIEMSLSEGTHIITLTVQDGHGGNASASMGLVVRPYLPHLFVDRVEYDPDAPIEGDVVTVNVTAANDGEARGDGVPVRLLVDGVELGNDTVTLSVGALRTVTFRWTSTRGDHVLRAEVGGEALDINLTVKANTVPFVAPVIVHEGKRPLPGATIQFKANASDGDDDELTYQWDFGDGSTGSTSPDPQHSYAEPGSYTVTLTVKDPRNGVTVRTMQVVVEKSKGKDSPGYGASACAIAVILVVVVAIRTRRTARTAWARPPK